MTYPSPLINLNTKKYGNEGVNDDAIPPTPLKSSEKVKINLRP